MDRDVLVPIKTDLDPAPKFLLDFIRCNCKTDTRNPCGGLNCSCKKHGLDCGVACGNCRGKFCNNVSADEEIDVGRNVFDIFDDL